MNDSRRATERAPGDEPWSVQDLLARHPWPEEHAGARRLEWLWHFDLALAPAELWPIVADTSRLNRALHVSEMTFRDVGGLRRGSARNGGRRHEWTEVPWSWVAGQWLESVRLYDRGYARVDLRRLPPRAPARRRHPALRLLRRGAARAAGRRGAVDRLRRAGPGLPQGAARIVASTRATRPSLLLRAGTRARRRGRGPPRRDRRAPPRARARPRLRRSPDRLGADRRRGRSGPHPGPRAGPGVGRRRGRAAAGRPPRDPRRPARAVLGRRVPALPRRRRRDPPGSATCRPTAAARSAASTSAPTPPRRSRSPSTSTRRSA